MTVARAAGWLVVCGVVFATAAALASNTIMAVRNAAGGSITLTYEPCGDGTLYAYATTVDQETVEGCWTHDPEMQRAIVEWHTGSITAYPLRVFVFSPVTVGTNVR